MSYPPFNPQGIGTLNETARNMFRQQPLNMPYGPAQQLAYQQPQFGMGGMQQGNGINLYGQYLERTYGDPEFDQKRDTFLQEVQQKERQTFGGMGGSFELERDDGIFGFPAISNEGYGLPPRDRFFGLEKAQIAEGLLPNEMQLFASGGEAMGPPPTRGPDPQGIGAFQQFAGGGEANRELEDFFNDRRQNEPPPARGLPPTKSPFEDGIRELEDFFSKPQGRGKGYFDDLNFRIDSYEIDGKPSYAIEFDDGFSLFEPQIIERMDENNSANEPIPGERTRKELFRYLFEKNPTSEEFFRYLKTTGLASGGEVSGPDPQGIGYFQQFADGGPVYMSNGGEGGVERIKDGVLQTVFDVESNGDFNRWHDNAQNIPETPLTQMTVSEIMGYQGGENGPAAGAGQIKYNTFQYLLNTGTLKPDEVFSPQVQRKAHSRLLDRRGFNEWVQGELSNDGFIQRLAREYAAVPLAQDEQVGDTLRESGKSRYGGSNAHRISLDNMRNVLTSLKSPSMASEAALDEAMYAADYLEPQTMPSFAEPEEAGPDLIDAQSFDSGVGSMMPPTTGEELRQGFRPRFGSPAQEDDYMSMVPQKISMRDKYSTENIAADLVGGEEALKEGIGGLTRSLRPNLRPSEIEFGEDKGGVFRSLMPKYRPLKRYPGSNPEGLFRGFQDLDLLLRKGVEQPATDIRGEPA